MSECAQSYRPHNSLSAHKNEKGGRNGRYLHRELSSNLSRATITFHYNIFRLIGDLIIYNVERDFQDEL